MNRRPFLVSLGVGGALAAGGCVGQPSATPRSGGPDGRLTLAATTTVHDSGLLDPVVEGFREAFDIGVKPIVKGSGAALRTARAGDVDVVLVHARPLEDRFLRNGDGVNRRTVMVNDFMVVGPPGDPAGAGGRDPVAAFRAIAGTGATFLSRGDQSGTHLRERQLWDAAGIDPSGTWYRETGQGMGNTLVAARHLGAYTLTDRGTFLATAIGDDLIPVVNRGLADPPGSLRNVYSTIATNPARHDVRYEIAMAFVGFLTGQGQSAIEDFRVDGHRAFRAHGRFEEPNFQQYVPSDWRQ